MVDLVVGVTHQDSSPAGTFAGARPSVFFTPDQMRKRTVDWGRDGLGERFAAACREVLPGRSARAGRARAPTRATALALLR